MHTGFSKNRIQHPYIVHTRVHSSTPILISSSAGITSFMSSSYPLLNAWEFGLGLQIPPLNPEPWYMQLYQKASPEAADGCAQC
jgi:hypothetical protein